MPLRLETNPATVLGDALPAALQLSAGTAEARPAAEQPRALDPAICWQAIYSRDPRFDGRFFAAATSTGLYCRNICPVPFAKPKNIVLFACAAAAEAAGFRPCRRCQPQAAPGTPAWLGSSAVVSRAFRLILEGALNEGNVDRLAERLGIGSRHLRRLFARHLGASPIKIATTHRIHLARRLLDESQLPITKIAHYAGFQSIREFNHALRVSAGQSPRSIRKSSGAAPSGARQTGLDLRLPYRPPFDWEHLIEFLGRRAVRGVEAVAKDSYSRTIRAGAAAGLLRVTQDKAASRLLVHLELPGYEGLAQVVERVRRIFDLNADPIQIANHLARDPRLCAISRQHPGLRTPGVWDGFEGAVLAMLGQSLTGAGNRRAIDRLVRHFGSRLDSPIGGLSHLFPRPPDLAEADLVRAGIPKRPAAAIKRLAAAAATGQLSFDNSMPLEETIQRLRETCGIEDSLAQWIAMRSYGEPDAFPSGDRGLLRSIGDGATIAAAELLRVSEPWRPWRAYAAIHLTA